MAQGRLRRLVTRRRVRRAVVCLILGGVMTVAVAWGCALYATFHQGGYETAVGESYLDRFRPDDWPLFETQFNFHGVGITQRMAYRGVLRNDPRLMPFAANEFAITELQYGLPVRTMMELRSSITDDPHFTSHSKPSLPFLASGVDVSSWLPERFGDRRLPLRPMWPGFLYSTLVYAAFAWPVLSAPSFLRKRRRLRRRRRGLCVQCKYPVRTFAVCPECGTPTELKP